MDIKQILGRNIKTLRKSQKLTQEQLSEKIGCGLNHLANIEIGKKYPSPELLSKIAEELDVPPSTLFRTEDSLLLIDSMDEIRTILDSQNIQTQTLLKKLLDKKSK